MPGGKFLQGAAVFQQLSFFILKILFTQIEVFFIVLQKGIVTKNCMFENNQLPLRFLF